MVSVGSEVMSQALLPADHLLLSLQKEPRCVPPITPTSSLQWVTFIPSPGSCSGRRPSDIVVSLSAPECSL